MVDRFSVLHVSCDFCARALVFPFLLVFMVFDESRIEKEKQTPNSQLHILALVIRPTTFDCVGWRTFNGIFYMQFRLTSG